jgi:PAS domain S-box-containing protein
MAHIAEPTHIESRSQSANTLGTAVTLKQSDTSQFQPLSARLKFAQAVALCASTALIALGVTVLIGWALGIVWLKSIGPEMVTMKPNTAVCLALSGLSLLLLRTEAAAGARLRVGQVCAMAVVIIGTLTVIEFVFQQNLGIDNTLFPAATAADGRFQGRMALATAVSLVLLGNALLFINGKSTGKSLVDILAGLAGALTLLSFLAYLYNVEALSRLLPFTGIALHTIIGLFILCFGLLFARAKDSFVSVFLSDTAGGMVARRLLPVAIVIPPLLGWFRLIGERRGLYEPAFGIAVVATCLVILLVTVIGRTARLLDTSELVRRRANERTRLVVEAAPSAIVMFDETGKIALVNRQTETLFGYSRAELLKKSVAELVPGMAPDFQEKHLDDFTPQAVLHGDGGNLAAQRKDGSEVPIEVGLNPIKTDDGNFVLAHIIDITKRKEAEDNLRQSEARAQQEEQLWKQTFDAIGEGILVYDRTGRIVHCNSHAGDMLEMDSSAVTALTFSEAFARMFGQRAADYYLADHHGASTLVEVRTEDDRRYLVSIFAVHKSDGTSVSVSTWNEVTRLSEMRDQLSRSRSLASVGQLAAGVAHEVNNPLAAITTCAEAITRDLRQERIAKAIPEDVQWNYYLEEIVRQALRCKEITRGLLDLTRQRQAKRTLCDINQITKQCARGALQRGEGIVEVAMELDEAVGEVATDAAMLMQILDNLLSNAVDAIGDNKGLITVATRQESARVVIEIKDTGPGIAADLLAKIFDPFFSTKGPGKGYGLGLAISATLAESLRGGLAVESKPGAGSTFRLWIPRQAPEN